MDRPDANVVVGRAAAPRPARSRLRFMLARPAPTSGPLVDEFVTALNAGGVGVVSDLMDDQPTVLQ